VQSFFDATALDALEVARGAMSAAFANIRKAGV
jgi:hypothetical protein